ncbi:MAG TPA: Gfo/Idh/MocA family oxidoreductase [Pseudoneobacillus sp.]|nr:Gfo/Idh/MocA family oxidoreductase [Pseudoneobacillus sp.]
MAKVRIGILGCASIAERYVIPAIIENLNYELIAIASRGEDLGKLERFSNKFNCEGILGYENLLNRDDIEVVYIPLPPGLHEEWVIKSLEKDKHVLIEKPSSTSLQSVKKMISIAKHRKLLIKENYMFEYHSQHTYVKSILNDAVGDIRLVRATFAIPKLNNDNFRYNKILGGGALLDTGGYPIKISQILLGQELIVKSAKMNYVPGFEVDMFGSATLENKDGIQAQISYGLDNFYQCSYEILGTKGKVVLDRAFTAPPGYFSDLFIEIPGENIHKKLPSDNHFIRILNHFYNSLRSYDYDIEYSMLLNQARLVDEIREVSKIG